MAYFQETRQPLFRVPVAALVLMAAMVLAHLLRVFVYSDYPERLIFAEYGFVPARYSPVYLTAHHLNPGTWLERALPFVTHLFLHGNWTHLIVNVIWLFLSGAAVARRFGPWLYILFFFTCGIAGALTHLAFNWDSTIPAIGASGAISGVMGARFRMLVFSSGAPERAELLPLLSPLILLISVLWIAINTVLGTTGIGVGPGVVIAWEAHLGGYLAGMLLSGPFDHLNRRLSRAGA
jgi:membrane associated rhomboid family serine protease